MIVPGRFCGPPGMANGGYLAGTLAGDRAAEVVIRRPVPVDVELAHDGDELHDAEGELLAIARPLDAEAAAALLDEGRALPAVGLDAARTAGATTPLLVDHPFPTCFACGPDHPTGLHCLAGPSGHDDAFAVSFVPPEATAPFTWAALDCPSAAPHMVQAIGTPHVLGRMAAVQAAPLVAGEEHVVVSRATGTDGRKRFAVSAIRDAGGATVAVARATWVALDRT